MDIEILDTDSTEKRYVILIFEDKETRVSWYPETNIEDIRFSILMACDSLVDGHFQLLDEKASKIDLDKIKDFKQGQVYFIKKIDNKPTNILVSGTRKIEVCLEPLHHIEAQVAVKNMVIGANLLKHTSKGYPHIRNFQLSSDYRRILWYTKSKTIDQSYISIESIDDIIMGQTSENFIRYPLKVLEDFSFTIYFWKNSKDKQLSALDITCKDEREFDLWAIGIKALRYKLSNKKINKKDLLSHCKSFQEQIQKGNIGKCSSFLLYDSSKLRTSDSNLNEKSLEKLILSRKLSSFEIANLILKLCQKEKSMKADVDELTNDETLTSGKVSVDYEMVFNEEAIVDDLDTQKNQMIQLFAKCEKSLGTILLDYLAFSKDHKMQSYFNLDEDETDSYSKAISELESISDIFFAGSYQTESSEEKNDENFIKEIDIRLWKVEIDLENVGDIINRFKFPQNEGFMGKLKGLFSFFK